MEHRIIPRPSGDSTTSPQSLSIDETFSIQYSSKFSKSSCLSHLIFLKFFFCVKCDLAMALNFMKGRDLEAGRDQNGEQQLYPNQMETPQLRWAFIRKVYMIVAFQLLITIGISYAVVSIPAIPNFVRSLAGTITFVCIFLSAIAVTIAFNTFSLPTPLKENIYQPIYQNQARERRFKMALVPSPALVAEVEMGADPSAPTVRATVVQASTVFYDTPATLDKADRLLAEAAGYGAQLVVFPEAFVGGYPRGSNFGIVIGNRTAKGKEEFRKYHASAIDVPGPEVDRLAAMAGKYKVFLVMGVIERDGYTLYCTVLFFDSQGSYLGKHRKIMPTALERIIWGFGDGSTIPVFETPIGKIGAAICWENRMPLLRTAMYAKGIEIYCAPTADSRDVWQASMTHIALEGGCFVLSANQFCRRKDYPPPPEYVFAGTEEELTPDSVVCAGGSVIISPSGAILAGPNYDGEALISADLDLGEIAREKFAFDVVGHYSRPEVLSLTVKDHPTNPVTFVSASAKTEVSHTP